MIVQLIRTFDRSVEPKDSENVSNQLFFTFFCLFACWVSIHKRSEGLEKRPLNTKTTWAWNSWYLAVWPDLAIYWTLGNFLKPLATINLPKSPTVLDNFCVCAKIFNFSCEIIFGQLLWTFGEFSLVTLVLGWTVACDTGVCSDTPFRVIYG